RAGLQESDVLRLAAGLERASEHPLAAAIVSAARQKALSLPDTTEFQSLTGKGVVGVVEGRRVALGNAKLFEGLAIDLGAHMAEAEPLRRDGQTVMCRAIDGTPAGRVGVAAPVQDAT